MLSSARNDQEQNSLKETIKNAKKKEQVEGVTEEFLSKKLKILRFSLDIQGKDKGGKGASDFQKKEKEIENFFQEFKQRDFSDHEYLNQLRNLQLNIQKEKEEGKRRNSLKKFLQFLDYAIDSLY